MKIDVSFLEKLDLLIRQGEGEQARQRLQELRPVDVPRPQRAPLAKIALRIGETSFAIALLRPLVQSETPVHPPVSNDELIQYGMCLKQAGASEPALKVFRSIEGTRNPEVYLYEAITLFTQWRYRESIPKLQAYLAHPALSEYQKRIGALNLASAFIFEAQYEEAARLLSPMIEEATRENQHLVRANGLELMAQVAVHQRDFARAEDLLKEGNLLIQHSAPVYRLFLEKWSAVLQLFTTGGSLESLQKLNWVREKAISLRHWETVRDCDFFFAIGKVDHHLARRLYFGTPYDSYRERLVRNFPGRFEIPSQFDWRGNTAHQPVIGDLGMIDLDADAIGSGELELKKNHQIVRLLKALSSDFYSPIKPFALSLALSPDDNLDPTAALPRIFSSVSRAKKWLKAADIPIEIESSDAGYRLQWTGPYIIRVPSLVALEKSAAAQIRDLQKRFATQDFTSSDAAECLRMPQRSVIRVLKDGVTDHLLEISGQGRSTRYRFKQPKAS